MVYIGPPAPKPEPASNSSPNEKQSLFEFGPAWKAYRGVRANWQEGDAFQKHYPLETKYRHSLAEESEALAVAAETEEKLRNSGTSGTPAAEDASLTLLLKLHHAGLIDAYVLFSLGDDGIAHDYAAYRAKNRAKLEEYMDKFVVPNL
jgi:hypothetical protein